MAQTAWERKERERERGRSHGDLEKSQEFQSQTIQLIFKSV